MAISSTAERRSRLVSCLNACAGYDLSRTQARAIIDRQVTLIREQWADAADLCELTGADRTFLFGRQILNGYAFDGYRTA